MTDEQAARAAQRARKFIYLLGALFAVLGFALDYIPALTDAAAPHSGRVCAALGTVLLVAARFGSERFIRRCAGVLSGWP
jgi:hypothetical protein